MRIAITRVGAIQTKTILFILFIGKIKSPFGDLTIGRSGLFYGKVVFVFPCFVRPYTSFVMSTLGKPASPYTIVVLRFPFLSSASLRISSKSGIECPATHQPFSPLLASSPRLPTTFVIGSPNGEEHSTVPVCRTTQVWCRIPSAGLYPLTFTLSTLLS